MPHFIDGTHQPKIRSQINPTIPQGGVDLRKNVKDVMGVDTRMPIEGRVVREDVEAKPLIVVTRATEEALEALKPSE
jgi:hypothetical protein